MTTIGSAATNLKRPRQTGGENPRSGGADARSSERTLTKRRLATGLPVLRARTRRRQPGRRRDR
jgi:hypothetical protein